MGPIPYPPGEASLLPNTHLVIAGVSGPALHSRVPSASEKEAQILGVG